MKFSLPNSVWPNGLKNDAEGYSVFYSLGTNKVNVDDITWPTGDELKSPFVYENGKLVGLFDSEALEGDTFDIPYTKADIVICGNPVTINLVDECDKFSITLTKSTSGPIIGKSGENEIPADYSINAPEMTSAVGMFSNRKIKSIKLNIPKLEDASDMFSGCTLTSEIIYSILESIPAGKGGNISLGVFPEDITESELIDAFAEKGWVVSSITIVDITGESEIRYFTILDDAQKDALSRTVRIVNNECYDETDTKIANFDTDKIRDLTNVLRINTFDFNAMNVDYTYSEGTYEETLDMGLSNLIHFDSNLSNLVNGSGLFNDSVIEYFKGDLSSLKQQIIDIGNLILPDDLEDSYKALYRLVFLDMYSKRMFNECKNFDSNIPLLENGNEMFRGSLRTFKGNLDSLKRAKGMFGFSREYSKNMCSYLYEMIKEDSDITLNSYMEFLDLYVGLGFGLLTESFSKTEKEFIIMVVMVSGELGINDVESFLNIINTINDLTKDSSIVHDEKTGEGYIDIDCCFTKEYFENVSNKSWEETLKILDDKGWKYHIKTIDIDLSESGPTENTFKFYKNYEIVEEEEEEIINGLTYKDIPQEKLEEVQQTTEIIENKCYINGELIKNFDLSKITETTSLETSANEYDLCYVPKCKKVDDLLSQYDDDLSLTLAAGFLLMGFFKIKEDDDDIIFLLELSEGSEEYNKFISSTMVLPLVSKVENSSLSYLRNANCLFAGSVIKNFDCDMENLEEASWMFANSSLENFRGNMPKLRLISSGLYGGMFYKCENLTSFEGDLSSLRAGSFMFSQCKKLSSFKSNLSSLEIGSDMFQREDSSILDFNSIDNIADTIKDMSNVTEREIEWFMYHPSYTNSLGEPFVDTIELGTLDVGLGFNPSEYNGKYGTWDNLKAAFSAKKWKVNFYFPSGSSESTTYGLRNRNTNVLYTKLEEVHPHTKTISKEDFDKKVDESDCPERYKERIKNKFKNIPTVKYTAMPRHDYTSQDGTKYYRLTHFHDSNVDYSDYDQFGSLEEAVEYYGVKPVIDDSKLKLADVLKKN